MQKEHKIVASIPKTRIVRKVKGSILPSVAQPLATPQPTSLGDFFSKLSIGERETVEKILTNLLNEINLGMKTDIEVPIEMARLEILQYWSEVEGCIKNAKLLEIFINRYKVDRVSFKRQSREEIIKAVSERVKKEDRTLGERLAEVPA